MKAYLVLANGMVFEGENFGAAGTSVGEVVFNTGMVGYEETLTDPSYYGQIITQTYPLVGNYGVNGEDAESCRIHAFGYIVREVCDAPSNFRCKETLDAFLKQQNIIGLQGVDTRRLTRIIRESGVMNGALTTEYDSAEAALADTALMERIRAYAVTDAVDSVTVDHEETYHEEGEFHVALMDFGYKRNILRSLVQRGCKVTLVPGRTTAQRLKELNVDGIMLSNGPGDPAENVQIIENLKDILAMNKPVFGICLGHQLTALAMGAKTAKLKYGHRGVNQPVTDFAKNRTFITSQNHGYAVVADTVDTSIAEVSHVNANDGTVEGVRYKNMPCFTVQFHPEACGGPRDTAYLFDEFVSMMKGGH
ncbi:glutamine-hydrolyzing carbamoyl-phosphate synthase small subunit [Ruthenibacterium sp. TH_2024_36131]|uniref:carbamoyl phosphate synthase small subunit n=1 Tax=Owariibacterium komagatae TaxID=3136601 RepID=UPI0038B3E16D